MDKETLILELVRDGKITTEQAKLLMQKEKEYITVKEYVYPYNYWNYGTSPYRLTIGTGASPTITFNSATDGTSFTATN